MAPAPRGRRVGARLVDLVVSGWVLGILLVEVEGRFLGGDPLATRVAQPVTTGQAVVGLVAVLALLEVLPTALWGRTIGKALLGLRVTPVGAPPGGRGRVGLSRALLRAVALFGPIAVPRVGALLVTGIGLSGLAPGGRGVHDLVGGTLVVDSPPGRTAGGRHRYPRRAVEALPLPEVARTLLVEIGLPARVPGAFTIDARMTVYDDVLFSVGTDPAGRAICALAGSGEVVAIDPEAPAEPLAATGTPPGGWYVAPALPAFAEVLEALAEDGPAAALRRLHEVDPDALEMPGSWWPEVLGGGGAPGMLGP